MPEACIYVDESGDLGWTLDKPYRRGGSSRYLVIGSLVTPREKRHLPKRLIRKLYEHFGWNPANEVKWAQMDPAERTEFCCRAGALVASHADIELHAIAVQKDRVQAHIRADANKLYNYMLRLSLIETMARCSEVTLIPDARSVKVKSGNSLHDYLQTHLWFERGSATKLQTVPSDSAKTLNLQFADMLSGAFGSLYEFGRDDHYRALGGAARLQELYFRKHTR